jgi:hypothetical protein
MYGHDLRSPAKTSVRYLIIGTLRPSDVVIKSFCLSLVIGINPDGVKTVVSSVKQCTYSPPGRVPFKS